MNENAHLRVIRAGIKEPPEKWIFDSRWDIVRIHYVISGEAIYKGITLREGWMYLMTYSMNREIDRVPGKPYIHMYIDFIRTPSLSPDMVYAIKVDEDDEILKLTELIECYVRRLYDPDCNVFHQRSLDPLYQRFASAAELMVNAMTDKCEIRNVSDMMLHECLHMMHTNYHHNLTNEMLANKMHLDKHYFIRYFKTHMRTTPQKYLRDYRLQKSIEQLEMGESVSKTAISCGFRNADTFSRAFSAAYGVSPSEYGKNHRIVSESQKTAAIPKDNR